MKNIICIIGYIASGKDTLANYISSKYGFNHIEISSILKSICLKKGIEPTRQNLIQQSNKLSEEYHDGYLAQWIIENFTNSHIVITGLRQIGQLEYLNNNSKNTIITIESLQELRFERANKRVKVNESKTLEDFNQSELDEHSGKGTQNLPSCLKLSDYSIYNNKDLNNLYSQMDKIASISAMDKIERTFLSPNKECPFNCSYCFAKTDSYKGLSLDQEEKTNLQIIYPSCDTELILDKAIYNNLLNSSNYKIVSISSKGYMSNKSLSKLIELDKKLKSEEKGFVKFAVSFSTKNQIDRIENKTSSFHQRLDMLKYISQNKVFTAVSLKPILPFIPKEEYFEIVESTKRYTKHYLLGGLYFQSESSFSDKFLLGYKSEERFVNWLEEQPLWNYIPSKIKSIQIRDYILENELKPFTSDTALIKDVLNQI